MHTCQPLDDPSTLCLKGDVDLDGCQEDTYCWLGEWKCPEPTHREEGTQCNNGSNVCQAGACVGEEGAGQRGEE